MNEPCQHEFHTYWSSPELVARRCECGETQPVHPRCQKTNSYGPRRGLQCLCFATVDGRFCITHTRAYDRMVWRRDIQGLRLVRILRIDQEPRS